MRLFTRLMLLALTTTLVIGPALALDLRLTLPDGGESRTDPTPPADGPGHPIDSDDTPPPQGDPASQPLPQGDGNGDNDPTPPQPQIPLFDSTPTGTLSCVLRDSDWGPFSGAHLHNTGSTVIHNGSVLVFHFPGGDVSITITTDIVPGGDWIIFDGGDPNFSFPAGTVVPYGVPCDATLILA